MNHMARTQAPLSAEAVAHYRRQGYWVLPGLLNAPEIAACHADLSDLASGRIPPGETRLMYEGCTLPHEPAEASAYWHRGALARPVVVEG